VVRGEHHVVLRLVLPEVREKPPLFGGVLADPLLALFNEPFDVVWGREPACGESWSS
jgi:hypothetical protein